MWHLVRVALLGVCWVIAMPKVGGTRYQVQFFRLQKLNRKIAYCRIHTYMFAPAFSIFCCFCLSTAAAVAVAVAAAAACFCCGCLCGCCRVLRRYDYEKKRVSRDSKMCCCCCRLCCGAPTTDEIIHASVLHDASQIDYCRYRGRALIPPITSIPSKTYCVPLLRKY